MVDWSTLWATVVVGLLVVFVVLVFLVFMSNIVHYVVAWATSLVNKRGHKSEQKKLDEVKKPALPLAPVAPAESGSVNSEGISGEVIAAISAAVAMMDSDKKYILKSVKRVKEARSAWNMAGITDNTKAF